MMSPLEFRQRLAALLPRPRLHLIRFHSVLASNAKLRALVVPQEPEPPAQAAHQQAMHLVGQIRLRLAGQPLTDDHYRDFGSLVSLGEFSTVGQMMGGLIGGSLMVEGLFARLIYESLYRMHELALHGWTKAALDTLARLIVRRTEPHVKLH